MTDSADGRRETADSSAEATDAAGSDVGDAEEVVVERLPPDEAFELLAHETRFRILETLNDADGALSFSDLRKRVGVRDAGQFNYHLGKVTGRFVRDADDGYELAAPGRRVVGAILSGGYTKALSADPVEMDTPCLLCGSTMDVEFRDDGVNIGCRNCDLTLTNANVPPGVLEGVVPEDVPEVVDRWLKRNHAGADFGFCYKCDGRLDETVRFDKPDEGFESVDEEVPLVSVVYECRRCGFDWYSSFPFGILLHPAVVGFHHEHDVDIRRTPIWELDWIGTESVAVENRDPPRVEVRVTLDDETAVFTFDEDLNVVEERRE